MYLEMQGPQDDGIAEHRVVHTSVRLGFREAESGGDALRCVGRNVIRLVLQSARVLLASIPGYLSIVAH